MLGLVIGACTDNNFVTENDPMEPDQGPTIATRSLSPLRVEGRYLKNVEGKIVNLHGFVQTYSPFFNENAWTNYNVAGCLAYNKGVIDRMLSAGWEMNFMRLHMDPYWSTTPGSNGRYEGHEFFEEARFRRYLDEVFVPMAEYCLSKGLYVVMRPPGVCPHTIAVGDDYNEYLLLVWDIVSSHPAIRNNTGIMFELANEPIQIKGTDGVYGSSGQPCFDSMKIFFQSITNKIREKANNIIWVPGLAYQSQYSGFANNPVTGQNIGYAVHVYPGWYGSDAEEASQELGGAMGGGYEAFQRGWNAQVQPVANIAPIMVTELDWAPAKYNASWGKSFTGTAGGSGFGANFKYIADLTGNVSWLIFTDCSWLARFRNEPGTPGAYTFLNDPEACLWPTYHWFKEYAAGDVVNGELQNIELSGVGQEISIITGSDRHLIVKATYAGGGTRYVTNDAVFTSSDPTVIRVEANGRIVALKDGNSTLSVTYRSTSGVTKMVSTTVRATTFPLTSDKFNPSIWENGTFDENTKTLVTGRYGFGGWKYNNGADLSAYNYLVAELDNDNQSSVSFRLFDENNYWSQPAAYNFGNSRRVVVDLNNMYKDVNGQQIRLNKSHIYIIGFWSTGGQPIVIKDVYLTNNWNN